MAEKQKTLSPMMERVIYLALLAMLGGGTHVLNQDAVQVAVEKSETEEARTRAAVDTLLGGDIVHERRIATMEANQRIILKRLDLAGENPQYAQAVQPGPVPDGVYEYEDIDPEIMLDDDVRYPDEMDDRQDVAPFQPPVEIQEHRLVPRKGAPQILHDERRFDW